MSAELCKDPVQLPYEAWAVLLDALETLTKDQLKPLGGGRYIYASEHLDVFIDRNKNCVTIINKFMPVVGEEPVVHAASFAPL
ncbi:MAG: hypothetical protein ACP5I3_11950 [Thermoproteus sp.]